jgi:hypothetical protein
MWRITGWRAVELLLLLLFIGAVGFLAYAMQAGCGPAGTDFNRNYWP